MKLSWFLLILCPFTLLPHLLAQDNSRNTPINILQFQGIPTNININNIIIGQSGLVYVATNNGLFLANLNEQTSTLLSEQVGINDAVEIMDELWAVNDHALFNVTTNTKFNLSQGLKVSDLEAVSSGLWIATSKGIQEFNLRQKKFIEYNSSNSKLASNHINFIHQDRNRIIWIGTDAGYLRIENDKWEIEDKDYKMVSTYENKEGQWIISEDDLFLLNQYNRYFSAGLDDGLYQGDIKDFAIDSKGKLYVASNILVRYDPYNENIESYSEQMGGITSKSNSVAIDQNDNVWIGTESNGVFVLRFSDNPSAALYVNIALNQPVMCHGDQNAELEAIVTGGIGPFSYSWNNGSDVSTAKRLGPGSYSVTVTDGMGSQFKAIKKIPEPNLIEIGEGLIKTINTDDHQSGAITVQASGGTGRLNYRWSNGAESKSNDQLIAGSYTLTVEDSRGCFASKTFVLQKPRIIPQLANDQIKIGTTLRIEQLFFQADSTKLTGDTHPVLEEIHDFLVNNPEIKIEIGGHTNTIPPHEYCDRLSTERAKTVAYYLYKKGIEEERISYVGYGKRNPITEDRSIAGRRKNQRVELKIIEI